MRTSVIVLLAVVVGYFAYNLWFAPEEQAPEPVRLAEEKPAVDPSAGKPVEETGGTDSEEVERGDDSDGGGPGLVIRPDLDLGSDAVPSGPSRAPEQPEVDSREQAAWAIFSDLKAARNASDAAKAKKLEDTLLASYPGTDAGRMVSFERGRAALQRYRQLGRSAEGLQAAHEARKLLTPALFFKERPDPRQHDMLRDRLRELADVVLFGSGKLDGVVHTYKTKSGDALSVLCNKVFPKTFGVRAEPGLIMAMNGLRRPQDLKAGVYIRVPAGEPTIVVVKREFRVYYLLDGAYVRDWRVGLGAGGSTPVGTFTIETKIKDPDWFPKQGVKIKHGDARNILGTRWMGFRDTPGLTGFGIHGTTLPDSIGKEESSGCVRMQREDVEELFGWTPRKTTVIIRN